MADWVLEYVAKDTYDVVRRGRCFRHDLNLDAAKRYVRRYRKGKEKVEIEEEDGYRVPLSSLP